MIAPLNEHDSCVVKLYTYKELFPFCAALPCWNKMRTKHFYLAVEEQIQKYAQDFGTKGLVCTRMNVEDY